MKRECTHKSTRFWREIWDNKKEHNKEAEWLKDLERDKRDVKQDNVDVVITVGMVKTQCRKRPDCLDMMEYRVFGIKKLYVLHEHIAKHMDDMLNGQQTVPDWMTLGRTIRTLFEGPFGMQQIIIGLSHVYL